MSDEVTTINQMSRPTRTSAVSILGWTALTLFCLLFFSLLKLPQSKLKNLIQGTITSTLSAQGVQFQSGESDLSISPFGITYQMKDVSLKKGASEHGLTLETLKISPSILALVTGKMGASFAITQDSGSLKGSFSSRNSDVSVSFKASQLNLEKMGVLPFLAAIQGSLILDGNGSLSGDFSKPATIDGAIKLGLSKIILDPQSIQGFAIPKISISEGTFELEINHGKVTLASAKLGKSGSNDDLIASATGDIQLTPVLDASPLNLKTRFSISQNITNAFVLIDAILGPAKQASGGYAYTITGPIANPNAVPGPAP